MENTAFHKLGGEGVSTGVKKAADQRAATDDNGVKHRQAAIESSAKEIEHLICFFFYVNDFNYRIKKDWSRKHVL